MYVCVCVCVCVCACVRERGGSIMEKITHRLWLCATLSTTYYVTYILFAALMSGTMWSHCALDSKDCIRQWSHH